MKNKGSAPGHSGRPALAAYQSQGVLVPARLSSVR